MKDIKTEDLIKELESRGFKWGYVTGHGDSEPCTWIDEKGEHWVIADVEKDVVLISPEKQFKEPVPYDKWF